MAKAQSLAVAEDEGERRSIEIENEQFLTFVALEITSGSKIYSKCISRQTLTPYLKLAK